MPEVNPFMTEAENPFMLDDRSIFEKSAAVDMPAARMPVRGMIRKPLTDEEADERASKVTVADHIKGMGEGALNASLGILTMPAVLFEKQIALAAGLPEEEADNAAALKFSTTNYTPETKLGEIYAEDFSKVLGFPFEVVKTVLKKATPLREMAATSVFSDIIKAVGGNPELLGSLVEEGGTLVGGMKLLKTPEYVSRAAGKVARGIGAESLEASRPAGVVPFAVEPTRPATGPGFILPPPPAPVTSGEVKTTGEIPVTKPFESPETVAAVQQKWGELRPGESAPKALIREALNEVLEERRNRGAVTAAGREANKTIAKGVKRTPKQDNPFMVAEEPVERTGEVITQPEYTGPRRRAEDFLKEEVPEKSKIDETTGFEITPSGPGKLGDERGAVGDLESLEKDIDITHKAIKELPADKEREALYAERSKMETVDLDKEGAFNHDEAWEKRHDEINKRIDELTSEIHKTPEMAAFMEAYNKKSKLTTRNDLEQQKTVDLANRNKWDRAPQHGTDIDVLGDILENGLKPGSALDYTIDKSWVSEYPVQIIVPSARRGRKIEHNNFYNSANTARVAKVIVDLDQYQESAVPNIKEQIAELQAKYPDVEFEIKGEPPKQGELFIGPERRAVERPAEEPAWTPAQRIALDQERMGSRIEPELKAVDKDYTARRLAVDTERIGGDRWENTYTLDTKGIKRPYKPSGESGAVEVSHPPGFYSKLEDVVTYKMSGKMSVEQLKKMLEGNQVTKAEIESTLGGLDEKGFVTKAQVLDEIKASRTELADVMLGEKGTYKGSNKELMDLIKRNDNLGYDTAAEAFADFRIGQLDPDLVDWTSNADRDLARKLVASIKSNTEPKFSSYQEPGSVPGSYREMFVTAPGKNQFADFDLSGTADKTWRDGHSAYSDIQNPIVRIRFNDRMVDGKKILFVEEMQGPGGDTRWKIKDKQGRDIKTFDSKKAAEEFNQANFSKEPYTSEGYTVERTVEGEQGKMPPALQSRIYDIGVKRVLSYAKENGYDGVAWTTGEMQANRYNLTKYLDTVEAVRTPNGIQVIGLKDGNVVIRKFSKNADELSALVGKDLAHKIASDLTGTDPNTRPSKSYSGLDLKIGGEGLKYLYDTQLPSLFKKYGKGEVGEIRLREKAVFAEGVDPNVPSYDKVSYTPISGKTPSSYPIYSGLDPTKLPETWRGLKRNINELYNERIADTTLGVGLHKTKLGLQEKLTEPERLLRRDPAAKEIFKELATAEEDKNAFLWKHLNKFLEATKKVKLRSESSERVGRALDNNLKEGETLTKQEQRAFDFFKGEYDFLINEYARRSAGSEAAYQKVLQLVGAEKPKTSRVLDLSSEDKAAYSALAKEAAEIRGTRKKSELPKEALEEYESIQQQMRDIRSKDIRKKLTEGEREAYDILSRKINDYLPHLFEPKELLEKFKTELIETKKRLDKTTNESSKTKYKNRINKLETAITTMQGGGLVTFKQLPKDIFFRFFEKRKGAEGYSYDAVKAYQAYIYGIAKKMYDGPALKRTKEQWFDNVSSELKPYVQRLVDDYQGKNRSNLDAAASALTTFEWIRTLGLNPRSALTNLTQRLNTVAFAGEKYSLKAEKLMLQDSWLARKLHESPEAQAASKAFEESGVAREVPQTLLEGAPSANWLESLRRITGFMFNKIELGNRKHAFLAGYLKALDGGATPEIAMKLEELPFSSVRMHLNRFNFFQIYGRRTRLLFLST